MPYNIGPNIATADVDHAKIQTKLKRERRVCFTSLIYLFKHFYIIGYSNQINQHVSIINILRN